MAEDNELLKKLQKQIQELQEKDKSSTDAGELLDKQMTEDEKNQQLLLASLGGDQAKKILAQLIANMKGNNWYQGLQPPSPNTLIPGQQTQPWQRPGPREFDQQFGITSKIDGKSGGRSGPTSDNVTPKGGYGKVPGAPSDVVPDSSDTQRRETQPPSGGTTIVEKRKSGEPSKTTTIPPGAPGGTTTVTKTFPVGGMTKVVSKPPASFSTIPPPPKQEWKPVTPEKEQIDVQSEQRYRAKTNLGLVESLASNERVTEEFKKMGFKDVTVTGSGRERTVEGTWGGTTGKIPSDKQITQIERQETVQEPTKPMPGSLELVKPPSSSLKIDRPPEHKTGPSAMSRPSVTQDIGGTPKTITEVQQTPQQQAPQQTIQAPQEHNKDWGKERLTITRSAKLHGANPNLIKAAREASKFLPEGYRVEAFSGYRPGDKRFHGKGIAVDFDIFDAHGNKLANYQRRPGTKQNFRIYEKFAQDSHKALYNINPELAAKHRFGGYFGSHPHKLAYGNLDTMHQDLGARPGLGMMAGSWEGGLHKKFRGVWDTPNRPSVGMGRVEDYQFGSYPDQKPPISTTQKTGKGEFGGSGEFGGGGATGSWEPPTSYSDPKDFKLPEDKSTLPAGMRNQNPGNIKYNEKVRWEGLTGPSQNTDQGDPQAVFQTHQHGMNAAARLAYNKYTRRGLKTVDAIIAGPGGWTAGAGTQPHEAAKNIARNMGISPHDDIDLTKPENMKKFLKAMVRQEHGAASKAYTDEMYDIAAKRATSVQQAPQQTTQAPQQETTKPSITSQEKTKFGVGMIEGKQAYTKEQLASRPIQQISKLGFEGFESVSPDTKFDYGSGRKATGKWSVPYGTYYGSPQALGPDMTTFYRQGGAPTSGAFSTVVNVGRPEAKTSTGFDPAAGRGRSGIQIHAQPGSINELGSAGCLAIPEKQWPAFREAFDKAYKETNGQVAIEVSEKGTRIVPLNRATKTISANEAIRNKNETGAIDRKPTPEQSVEHSKKEITDRLITPFQKETGRDALTVEADESGKPKETPQPKVVEKEGKTSPAAAYFLQQAKSKEADRPTEKKEKSSLTTRPQKLEEKPISPISKTMIETAKKEAKPSLTITEKPKETVKPKESTKPSTKEEHPTADKSTLIQKSAVEHKAAAYETKVPHQQPAPSSNDTQTKNPSSRSTMGQFVHHRQEKRNTNLGSNWTGTHTNPSAAASSRVENAFIKPKTGRDDSFSTAGLANA